MDSDDADVLDGIRQEADGISGAEEDALVQRQVMYQKIKKRSTMKRSTMSIAFYLSSLVSLLRLFSS